MTEFAYIAADEEGKERKGSIHAEDAKDAAAKIKAEGLVLMELNKVSIWNRQISLSGGRKAGPRELAVFSRQMVSMLRAGVTAADAIEMLSLETDNKKLKDALEYVEQHIKTGEAMSLAMTRRSDVFPEMMINLVTAGEETGKLDVAFERVAAYFEQRSKIRDLLQRALTYPAIVGIATIVVIFVMLLEVIPNYARVFESMGSELPGITLGMLAFGDFIASYWFIIVGVILAFVIIHKVHGRTENGRMWQSEMALKMPLTGKLRNKLATSNFARTFSSLISSGVPMLKALHVTAASATNEVFKKAIEHTEDEVFAACEEAVDEIYSLIRKISSMANTYHFIVTSDHGFIYKRNKVQESDKIGGMSGKPIVKRRYVVSHQPVQEDGVCSLSLGYILGNDDDKIVSFPVGTSVFKTQGSGGQNYVHGGSSPEEMLVPVVEVKMEKGKAETTSAQIMLVSLVHKITNLITTLDFIQTEPVSDVVKPATYKVCFIDDKGQTISNEAMIVADKRDTDSAKRVFRLKFTFKNQKYDRNALYYLVAIDTVSGMEAFRHSITMDLAFADDFGFGL